MVAEWMHSLYGAVRVERVGPTVASRVLAYGSIALYSGLAATRPSMTPLSGVLNGLKDLPAANPGQTYDPTITAVAAERTMLDSLLAEALPTTRAALGRLADSLASDRVKHGGVSESVRRESAALGQRIGDALVAWSHTDAFDSTRGRPYVPPVGPGLWVNDNPATTFATQNLSGASSLVVPGNPANVMKAGEASDRGMILSRPKAGKSTLAPVNMSGITTPYWGQVRPFVLKTWNECPVPAAATFSKDTTSALYKNAKEVYDVHNHLTPEQKAIALYWADNPGESGTPGGHWIAIAAQLMGERNMSVEDAAKLMLVASLAQADAFIASWGYKFQFNLLRPRTYIRAVIDSTYEPFIPTPPFPEHPAGHSTQSAAAATALIAMLGDTPFDDSTSLALGHAVRHFTSFRQAAEEAGQSRIYAGIHYPSGNLGGRQLGTCVGEKVVERLHITRIK